MHGTDYCLDVVDGGTLPLTWMVRLDAFVLAFAYDRAKRRGSQLTFSHDQTRRTICYRRRKQKRSPLIILRTNGIVFETKANRRE